MKNLLRRVKWAVTTRGVPPPDDDFWYSDYAGLSRSGVPVNEKSALNYSAVFNAITLYSNALGYLPVSLMRKKKSGGSEVVTEHNVHQLLHFAANDFMPSSTLRETAGGHIVGWGNSYSIIERDGKQNPIGLILCRPDQTKPEKMANGMIRYLVQIDNKELKIPWADMLHIPGLGFDGLVGYSVISKARETIGLGLATEQFGAQHFGNGTHPGVVVSTPGRLAPEAHQQLKKDLITKYSGLGKSHKLLLLQGDMKIEKIGIPPEDSQFLETRQFQIPEIARWFNLPPHKLKDLTRATFSNIEHQNIEYVVDSILPWLIRHEQYYNFKLLTDTERRNGLHVKYNVDAMLRGDAKSRAEYFYKMWSMGAMNRDEIREKEDLNPIPGGDKFFVPINYIPDDQIDSIGFDGNQRHLLGYQPQMNGAAGFVTAFLTAMQEMARRNEIKKLPVFDIPEERAASDIIKARDRITKRYSPLMMDAAQRVVSKETLAVKNAVKKFLSSRSMADFNAWLETFYGEFNSYVKKQLGTVYRTYGEAIAEAAAAEIGLDIESGLPDDIYRDIDGYIDGYVKRHVDASKGQIVALAGNPEDDIAETIPQRMDEWHETRAGKIVMNETVRGACMTASAIYFVAGLGAVWRIRGEHTCPYCQSLNGKKVGRGQTFLDNGDFIKLKGQEWMKINGKKKHPPLHQGCDCYITAG